ncbi:hypothetical protein G7Z17_g7356 [Cylindrodendrum hubeiense]|uniref:Secreted protein n=1 Tax=Cylindrodendrum hubeiense TaxID=595255 RepID=A0A9P5HBJ9_9HYPO|nr:hypothetical protein G7Z17_g7356 [Cylindrodendrum hubeiense]
MYPSMLAPLCVFLPCFFHARIGLIASITTHPGPSSLQRAKPPPSPPPPLCPASPLANPARHPAHAQPPPAPGAATIYSVQ